MDRERAMALVKRHVSKKNLIKHMLATEAAMSALAVRLGEPPEKWALAGLLHDLDYDTTEHDFPRHGHVSHELLSEHDVEADVLDAIRAHPSHEGFPPTTPMDKALHAVDGLTGLIVAAALMHPDKKLASLDTKFVMRRFGEKRFAAGANREQISTCEEIGIPLEEFVEITLDAMKSISGDLGL
ncbi:MAG TPA: HDIG domain-containing protein [candidate division Zixibacteria bacterium]|nr:HDIG domain-containing protein [candidate division Zixibacteria bacterium]